MKKAMLFMIALLFSVGASAASFTITNYAPGTSNASLNYSTTGSKAFANYDVTGSEFAIGNNVTTTQDTWAQIEWTFNKVSDFLGSDAGIAVSSDGGTTIDTVFFNDSISGVFIYNLYMLAGKTYVVDLFNGAANPLLNVTLSVSQVPVPAALWLFAPALLGFFGLRRKSSSQALIAA